MANRTLLWEPDGTCTNPGCPKPLCADCVRLRQQEYGRRYRAKNPQRARANYQRWVERHPKDAKKGNAERMRRWRAAHPEKSQSKPNPKKWDPDAYCPIGRTDQASCYHCRKTKE